LPPYQLNYFTELDKLAKETREKGVEWTKLKARLDL